MVGLETIGLKMIGLETIGLEMIGSKINLHKRLKIIKT